MCDQQSLRSACTYAQSDQSLRWSHEYPITVKPLTEHDLEFLSLTRGCIGSSESTIVKMPHCWKSHVAAQICLQEAIEAALEKVCTVFPDTTRGECKAFVDQYTPEIVSLLTQGLDPKEVCTKLGLCQGQLVNGMYTIFFSYLLLQISTIYIR